MTRISAALALSIIWRSLPACATYYPLYEYSGKNFFSGFDFYGGPDNTTWGNVTYLNELDATTGSDPLAYVNPSGNAIMKVDNTSTVEGTGILYRNSVRITSKQEFPIGSLFVIDALHMPYGCSVWPSIWLNGVLPPGEEWPAAGEMDLVEAINGMSHNQMAIHSFAGCVQSPNVAQSGQTIVSNCNDTSSSGCTVAETKPNSYGPGFADAKGGVFALQFDVAGVFMWFWSRPNVPASIAQSSTGATIEIADWGTPSAAYPASGCDIAKFFPAQRLVINISLCGLWAGIPEVYAETCPGNCLINNILGNGSNYANAFFEIPYIRTYSPNPVQVGSSTSSAPPDQSSDTGDQNNQQKIGSSPRGFYSSWLLLFLSSLSVAVLL